jgi:hypothetical protein
MTVCTILALRFFSKPVSLHVAGRTEVVLKIRCAYMRKLTTQGQENTANEKERVKRHCRDLEVKNS